MNDAGIPTYVYFVIAACAAIVILIGAWEKCDKKRLSEEAERKRNLAKDGRKTGRDTSDAYAAFKTGKKIFQEAVSIKGEGWKEAQLSKIKEALKYFDEAIENGFDESEVFSLRGSCLNDLEYYFEALEDYNKAIAKNPRKGIASNYHMRSIIKDSLFDYDGSMADIKEAIRLSKLDNEDNEFWNNYAKSTGFASQTAFYELMCLSDEELRIRKKLTPKDEIDKKLKAIKRREVNK